MKLRDLFKGTNVIPRIETPEWHPLDELDDEPGDDGMLPLLDKPQCTAITSKGERCKNPPRLPDSDRCALPSHQRVTASTAASAAAPHPEPATQPAAAGTPPHPGL